MPAHSPLSMPFSKKEKSKECYEPTRKKEFQKKNQKKIKSPAIINIAGAFFIFQVFRHDGRQDGDAYLKYFFFIYNLLVFIIKQKNTY